MKTAPRNPKHGRVEHGRVERVVGYFATLGCRLQGLADKGEFPPDVVEALVLDFESRWASMDVILAAYERLPFGAEVEQVGMLSGDVPVAFPPFTADAAWSGPPLRVETRRKAGAPSCDEHCELGTPDALERIEAAADARRKAVR